jgi:hypothetical protein
MNKLPPGFTRECFYGFDMSDDEVGPGEHRDLAVEIKHLFEAVASDADEKNEEIYLSQELDHALRRFIIDPTSSSLEYLLDVSPTLAKPVADLTQLLRMAAQPENRSE